jgi:hypothetical protein
MDDAPADMFGRAPTPVALQWFSASNRKRPGVAGAFSLQRA